jgi:hypothetical protein
MKENILSDILYEKIPAFNLMYGDSRFSDAYSDFGDFGLFIEDLWKNLDKEESQKELKNIFTLLGSILEEKSKYQENIENIFDVEIYELLICLEKCYEITKKYMPPHLYNHFLVMYPKEKHEHDHYLTKNYFKIEEIKSMKAQGISIKEEWEKKKIILLKQIQ